MKVFVTGATGFIGPHVIRTLRTLGIEVLAFARPTSRTNFLEEEGVAIVRGRLEDPQTYSNALQGSEVVLHMAGLVKALEPQEFYRVNQGLTQIIAKTAIEAGAKRFVYISSIAAVGPSPGPYPRPAELPPQPVSDYGQSKLMAETTLKELSRDIQVIVLRPTIIYGEGDKAVLKAIAMAVKGGFLATPNPDQVLTYVHVQDVADVIGLAVKAKLEAQWTVIPVEEGQYYTWWDTARVLSRILGRNVRVLKIPKFLVKGYCAASQAYGRLRSKAPVMGMDKCKEALQDYWVQGIAPLKELLRFTPRIDLETGMRRHILWARNQGLL